MKKMSNCSLRSLNKRIIFHFNQITKCGKEYLSCRTVRLFIECASIYQCTYTSFNYVASKGTRLLRRNMRTTIDKLWLEYALAFLCSAWHPVAIHLFAIKRLLLLSWDEMCRFVVCNLTHWGRVTHICVSKLTIIGSDNGLSPDRRQAIIWTNAGILLIGQKGTNFSENLIEIHIFSFKKMYLKMSFGKWRPFCLGLNVLNSRSTMGL